MFLAFKRYGFSVYDEQCDVSVLPLDPVSVTGGVDPKRFPFLAFAFVVAAVEILTLPGAFTSMILKPGIELHIEYGLRVSSKWRGHETNLKEYGLLKPMSSGEVKFLSSYFAVRKRGKNGNPDTARSIFNGKRLSRHCIPPPPVCLPEIPEMLTEMATLHASISGNRDFLQSPVVLTADFRHWFHQIGVSYNMSQFFGLSFRAQEFLRWVSLPMGFSWSPRLAQCLCWGIVLGDNESRSSGLSRARTECQNLEHPPSFVYIYNEAGIKCGLVFCWYDNVTLICYHNQTAFATIKDIKDNARRAGATWKNFDIHQKNLSTLEESNTCSFLGITIGIQTTLGHKAHRSELVPVPSSSFLWRHEPDKISRIMSCKTELLSPLATRRSVARGIGYIIWDSYISGVALCKISEHIDLMKINTPARIQDWNTQTPLSISALHDIRMKLTSIENNLWRGHPKNIGPVAYVASDSSDAIGGYTIFDDVGNVIDNKELKWDCKIAKTHIFLKELLAAVIAIKRLVSKHPHIKRVCIACDNTAVCHVLRKMYSNNKTALELVRRVYGLNIALSVIGLRGIDNVADCITRGVPICEVRRKNTWKTIIAAESGYRLEAIVQPHTSSRDEVRHSDESSDDNFREFSYEDLLEEVDEGSSSPDPLVMEVINTS